MTELQDISEFEPRIKNWCRWARDRKLYGSDRAGSAEGAYSGPQGSAHPTGWGDWETAIPAPAPLRVFINIPDAIEVNRGYVHLAILAPRQARILKILLFKDWWRPQWQAQHLGIHHLELGAALYNAKTMLFNQCKMRDRSQTTVKAVPHAARQAGATLRAKPRARSSLAVSSLL